LALQSGGSVEDNSLYNRRILLKLRSITILLVVVAVLGVILFAVTRPKPTTPVESIPYIWDFNMDDLQHIVLSLPRSEQSESFILHEDRYFYFDVENGSIVDMVRWGGGIPLLLSGPRADRVLVKNATDALLKEYGFEQPNLAISLILSDNTLFNIELGNATPSGNTYYIRIAGERDIYTVDSSWYDVISGLVTNPPYPPANFVCESLTFNPPEGQVNQPVTISAVMVNQGAVIGQFTVELKVNGVVEGSQNIELGRDESTVVTFTITKSEAKVYSINVAGKSAGLRIK
jgi:hypothetical protein